MTSANTNDIPIVLSCPMSCHVDGEVGAMGVSVLQWSREIYCPLAARRAYGGQRNL
jgi:hypothetical protein